MPFKELRLIEPLLRAVKTEGYTIPTAIQKKAIPLVLEGKDLLGSAQTGTGKTAAFALPILQRLATKTDPAAPKASSHAFVPIRALILTPTRELAAQILDSFTVYGRHTGLRQTVVYGGVSQRPQTQALRKGVDILVATPGRLLDLMNQRMLTLRNLEIFVLDEADRMMDMGFIHDIRRVIAELPAKRQTLMFSATMPREIRALAEMILNKPVEVKIEAQSPAADTVMQTLYHVEPAAKPALLEHLLQDTEISRVLVFARTKHGADKVVKRLSNSDITAEAIHSNKSQNARQRALANFKKGTVRVLVASDIAARGLDVDGITHVINYDMPNEPETYVHRIGRTGRAGVEGKAISFCSGEQRDWLKAIERMLGRHIPVLATPKLVIKESAAGQRVENQDQPRAAHAVKTHAPKRRKPPSPEQQKNNFWQKRGKPTGRPSSRPPGRGRGRAH